MIAKTTEKTRITTGISTATRCPMYVATPPTPRARRGPRGGPLQGPGSPGRVHGLRLHRDIVHKVPRADGTQAETVHFLRHGVVLGIV